MSDAGLPECFSLLFICKVTLLCRETCERDEVEPSKNNAKKGGGETFISRVSQNARKFAIGGTHVMKSLSGFFPWGVCLL